MSNLFQGTTDNFKELIDTQGKVILVDFYAEWCAPCRALSPILENIAEKYPDLIVVKVDVDKNGEIGRGNPYNVRGIPQMFFVRDGEVKSSVNGLQSLEKISEFIDPLLN